MRSSDSTRSPPPDSPILLYLERVGDDHPKACTGRRLLDRGLALPAPRRPPRHGTGIVLDPHADHPLSRSDRERALRSGVYAVDCSWNRLGERGRFPEGTVRGGLHRRLPWLLAGNPQHFGRLAELNTAEALAAALDLLGEPERARALLGGFPGGAGFFELNGASLAEYRAAADEAGVRATERRRFG